jgi:DNA-directed RNA polymerase specialized sigma24 family protein
MIEFVASESGAIRNRLDVLSRFVLILCGVEQRPSCEAARLLGISKHAVDVAYCAALDSLEVIWCEAILESGGCVAPFN